MASKRKRSTGSWEYVVKKKGVLPRPISLTFYDEAEGDRYVAHLEALLAKGIVPEEFKQREQARGMQSLADAIDEYQRAVHITDDDIGILKQLRVVIGSRSLMTINHDWAESWVRDLQAANLAPSTVRKKVGALARCLDWVMKRKDTMLSVNPLRTLPKSYASKQGGRTDAERDRRLQVGEELRIMGVLRREKPDDRQRPLDLPDAESLTLMFTLALETAMRLREIYTLSRDQVDLKARTIFLDKTKNGDKRQVPLSSVLMAALNAYLAALPCDNLFPQWDGSHDAERLRATSGRLSQQWARIFSAAKCDDLRFHDLRHEATSRLYVRTTLSDIQISRITGHKSLAMLRRYANLRGSDLANSLW